MQTKSSIKLGRGKTMLPFKMIQTKREPCSPSQPLDQVATLLKGKRMLKNRVSLQGRALRIFGQWRRVSRSGVPTLNSCQCSYDSDIDAQDIDPLILEYLSNKFVQSESIQSLINQYHLSETRFRSGISCLLDDVIKSDVNISDAELDQVLSAIEISIRSIEEMIT
jgi:hypothetical protein